MHPLFQNTSGTPRDFLEVSGLVIPSSCPCCHPSKEASADAWPCCRTYPTPHGCFNVSPLVQRLVRFVLATVGRMLALGEKPELGHRLKTYRRVKDTKFDLKKILEETRLTAIQYTLLKWNKLQLPTFQPHKTDFFCRFCRAELSPTGALFAPVILENP